MADRTGGFSHTHRISFLKRFGRFEFVGGVHSSSSISSYNVSKRILGDFDRHNPPREAGGNAGAGKCAGYSSPRTPICGPGRGGEHYHFLSAAVDWKGVIDGGVCGEGRVGISFICAGDFGREAGVESFLE